MGRDRLCRCVFVGNENSALVAPLSFSPHFVPSDIVCRICLPFAASLMYALRPSGGNPAETNVKQEEHHGRNLSERGGISQSEQRDLSERKEERLAKDRKRLISVILLPPRQDGEMGVFVSWEPSELHVNPLSL